MNFTPRGYAKFLKGLKGRYREAAVRGVQVGAQRCVAVLQQRVLEAPPASANGRVGAFDTGAYRRGWRADVLRDGARVGNDTAQAPIIDGGRKRGSKMPPTAVIARWAQRRLRLGRDEAARAAYPIALAIARRGLRPRRVLSGARDQLKALVLRGAREEMMRFRDAERQRAGGRP